MTAEYENEKYLIHICQAGERWDTVAFLYYTAENMASKIMDIKENRKHAEKYIFEGGEELIIPIVSPSEMKKETIIPPWR